MMGNMLVCRAGLLGALTASSLVVGCAADPPTPGGEPADGAPAARDPELQARVDEVLASIPAEVGEGTVRLPGPAGRARLVVHLPERMMPTVREVRAADGTIEPGPALPRWIAYGDSITEGWTVTTPGASWSMVAARRHGLDRVLAGPWGSPTLRRRS